MGEPGRHFEDSYSVCEPSECQHMDVLAGQRVTDDGARALAELLP
ncbi:MAG TPA: hypothetical protein VK629_11385 [Steroidobacteraceae bacterium]|nr:hypothetical protein [Steroidobacteraceae bacterium]